MASDESKDQAPRRSSRISAQSKGEVLHPVEKTKKPLDAKKSTGNKKRAAAVVDDSKKVKSGEDDADADDDDDAESAIDPHAPIDIGDTLPSITLKNEKGEDIDTGSITVEKGVVLFLVPKADTPGCTMQACGFRDIWKEFASLAYDVYGVSADASTVQSKWQTKKELPFPLISDPKRSLIGILGAADGNKTKRSHFVFEKGGKLLDKKMPVKPADSPRLALEFIKELSQ